MLRSGNEIVENLKSTDLARVNAAIRALKDRMERCEWLEMAPLGIDVFCSFGNDVPQETQLDFLELIRGYRAFVPPLSDEEKVATSISLVLRYGEKTQVTYDVALHLKISPNPEQVLENALSEITRQGLSSPKNVRGAQFLVSCLLDGKPVIRKTTLEALRRWPREAPYTEVKGYVIPQLEPDEIKFLESDD